MKILVMFLLLSVEAFAQTKSLNVEVRNGYCYLTVTEQIIISSGKDTVMAGNIRIFLASRDYQRARRMLPGKTFRIKSLDGSRFRIDDPMIKSFCVTDSLDCSDVSENNKAFLEESSNRSLRVICEDRPMVDI